MTEDNAKINPARSRVTVKVYEDTRDLMERFKMRFKSKDRPDYADIVEPAVAEYLAKQGTSEKPKVTPIREDVRDESARKILDFFDQATGTRATAGDSTIARLVLERIGLTKELRHKGKK